MAGDWIKWTKGLTRKREVIAIATKLGIGRHEVASRLMEVWEWGDDNTADGDVPSVTKACLDELAGVTGFAEAMAEVGWLNESNDGLQFPNFDRHNGQSAKSRGLTANRMRKKRSNELRGERNKSVTREEKRREESKIELPTEVCAEHSSTPAVRDEPSEFEFPTTGKGHSVWTLTVSKLEEYRKAYPGLDVDSELRKARQWCRDNKAKRKTAGGMLGFLTRWLNRAVDKPGRGGGENGLTLEI